jgi:hypothetical protein
MIVLPSKIDHDECLFVDPSDWLLPHLQRQRSRVINCSLSEGPLRQKRETPRVGAVVRREKPA